MNNDRASGASLNQGASLISRFKMLIRLHKLEAGRGIKDILINPFSNSMTALVIAIALALPAGLQIMLDNGKHLSQSWDGASRISLFLSVGLSERQTNQLANQIRQNLAVETVETIHPSQALADFGASSGFSEAIAELESNPLPPTLVVQPAEGYTDPAASEKLLAQFEQMEHVDKAKLDLDWVKRLFALLNLAEKLAAALGLALGIAVLLIVGNTIRLSVQNRRDEIEIIKLIGATDAFIRRPFLYTGFWYGLFAGILCWIILEASLFWLESPVAELASSYQSQFKISGLNLVQCLQLITISCVLGLLGSWLSVGRHIRQIEPK